MTDSKLDFHLQIIVVSRVFLFKKSQFSYALINKSCFSQSLNLFCLDVNFVCTSFHDLVFKIYRCGTPLGLVMEGETEEIGNWVLDHFFLR